MNDIYDIYNAVRFGKLSNVQLLLEQYHRREALHENSTFFTAVTDAVEKDYVLVVDYIIDTLMSYNTDQKYLELFYRIMLRASSYGKLHIVKKLDAYKLPFNKLGQHPISYAILGKSINIVKYFIENGVNINYDIYINEAIELDYIDIAEVLISNGCIPRDISKICEKNQVDILRIVYKYSNKYPNIIKDSERGMLFGSINGHTSIVKILVENGVNIHMNDDRPLQMASEKGHLSTVKYLVESGADINALNNRAIILAHNNRHTHVVKYLAANVKVISEDLALLLKSIDNLDNEKLIDNLGNEKLIDNLDNEKLIDNMKSDVLKESFSENIMKKIKKYYKFIY